MSLLAAVRSPVEAQRILGEVGGQRGEVCVGECRRMLLSELELALRGVWT